MKTTLFLALVYSFFGITLAHAQDSITLTRMNAYATLCNAQEPCSRELDNSIITIELKNNGDGTQSGSFDDFSHLPTGELFSYQVEVSEMINPAKPSVTITVKCQLENRAGDLVFECPKSIRKFKSRALVKIFNYEHEVSIADKKYTIQLTYTAAE